MRTSSVLWIVLAAVPCGLSAQMPSPPAMASASKLPTGILDRDQAGALFPATVFYAGQTAAIQARNSAGIKLADGSMVLFALVDTSGYASNVQATYQAYMLSETPVRIDGQELPAGAYGFGFIEGDRAAWMDLGGHRVLTAHTERDAALRRPVPLQIVADASHAGSYRLFLGRAGVIITPVVR